MAILVNGPLLDPRHLGGQALSDDMVFVPRQPLTAAALGLGDTLPRAVPQDAFVAALGTVLPGGVVQRLVLLAACFLAPLGSALLVPASRALTRAIAATTYGWSGYLAERLVIGHWGLLMCWAALPWLVRCALRLREGGPLRSRRGMAALVLTAAPSCLVPTGGLVALAVASVILFWPGAGRAGRVRLAAIAAVAALDLPWLVAGVLATSRAVSGTSAVDVFAARGENWSGVPGAVLGLGGTWNAATVPVSRTTVAAPLLTALLLVLAGAGIGPLRRRWSGAAAGVLALGAAGVLLALAARTPGLRELLALLVEAVPAAGLLRDGQKYLVLYAVPLALCAALGAERVAAALDRRALGAGAAAVLIGAFALPLAALPDLAWGVGGRIRPVEYPADWQRVADVLAARAPAGTGTSSRDGRRDRPDDLVTLPYAAFRRFDWNGGRTVLDPAARWFDVPVVVDDELPVATGDGTVLVPGESRRAGEVRDALSADLPLASIGVRWVLVERGTAGPLPPRALDGMRPLYRGETLLLYERDPGTDPGVGADRYAAGATEPGRLRTLAVVGAHLAALVLVLACLLFLAIRSPRGATCW
jgi:hypothetical protein